MTLAVVAAHADGQQRQSERHNLAATATLTALVCGRVVPGEQIPGLVTDLSATGAGVKVADARPRPPDLMHLYCRFLEGPIDCDVRIMRSDTDPTGASKLGCLFVDPSPTTVDLVVRVIRRLAGTSRDG